MKEVQVQDVAVDVCDGGCGGIWFDWFELKKVDEPDEVAGEALLDVHRNANVVVDTQASRQCPRCENQIMWRHFASVKREVSVDECPACAGFFLDHGELNALRDQFATEDERAEAAQQLFDEMFDGDIAKLEQASEDKLEKSRRLAHMFRFLLPSYYLKGKQPWGAF
jgi:Zn-finger nucleic acid-binding protein